MSHNSEPTASHIYTESGMTVDLTNYLHFRFQDCQGYKKIKGLGIKEMDFGWWNENNNCLYLLELKDYTSSQRSLTDREKSAQLLDNLWKKSVDVLFMLSALWLNNEGSREIKPCFPEKIYQKCNIRIYHLINCDRLFEPHLLPLNTKLLNRFKGYTSLFENILTFRIISSRQAERIFKDHATNTSFVKKASE